MQDKLFKKLTSNIYTVQDFHSVLWILRSFFDTYFFKEHKNTTISKAFSAFIRESEEAEGLDYVWENVDTDFLNVFTKENSNTTLHELEDIAKSTPHMVLYVPVLLPHEEVLKLSKWIRENIATNILIDMKVDALAVGGCNFVWNGIYHDYSMQYFIEKKRSDITDMLRSFKQ